jgi:hypothetical protein
LLILSSDEITNSDRRQSGGWRSDAVGDEVVDGEVVGGEVISLISKIWFNQKNKDNRLKDLV